VWIDAKYNQLQKLEQTIYNIKLFLRIIQGGPKIPGLLCSELGKMANREGKRGEFETAFK